LDGSFLLALLHKILEKIVPQLFIIRPFKNVSKQSKRAWHSLADDPQLHLKSIFFIKGWYMVSMNIDFLGEKSQVAKIYPNYGLGFSEKTAFTLPHLHAAPTYKVIYLEKRPQKLRFDPVEDQIDFTIQTLKFFPLSEKKAKYFMLEQIAREHTDYRKFSMAEIENKLIHEGGHLLTSRILSIYNETFSSSHSEVSYQHWIKRQESKQLKNIQSVLSNTKPNKLISILLPTYNSNPLFLEACINSVLQQSYQKWQLCIVDDASTETEHIGIIEEFVEMDERIIFHKKSENTHISDTTNACLKLAKGKYTLLLDHDDMLPRHTLLMMVNQLQTSPNLKLIYADEDKIDVHNARYEPHFKPAWNPDLLYSQNYIGHPVLMETERVKALGGMRTGVEGSQDHDLLLRYTADLTANQIHRIPQILYHWRSHIQSTASNATTKNYTTQAGINALKHHFESQQINAIVSQGKFPNTYRVNWHIPENLPLVTLIIPTYNGHKILKTCINSILNKTTYANYEVIIIDNRTNCEKTLGFINSTVANNSHIRVLKWDQPFNFSAINNFGVSQAKGEIVGLINNDIEVISPDWLSEMVSHAIRPEIGCVGAKLYYPNNKIQHAGVILGIGGVAGHSHKHSPRSSNGYFSRLHLVQNFSAVTAACLIVRKNIYNQVGGLDEVNLPVAFNDVDFCMRVREAGYRNLWTPYAELYHHESISRGSDEETPEKQMRALKESTYMRKKWQEKLQNDAAYNPNLTIDSEDFSLL
jgi:O-antigen biosynthesis protein